MTSCPPLQGPVGLDGAPGLPGPAGTKGQKGESGAVGEGYQFLSKEEVSWLHTQTQLINFSNRFCLPFKDCPILPKTQSTCKCVHHLR